MAQNPLPSLLRNPGRWWRGTLLSARRVGVLSVDPDRRNVAGLVGQHNFGLLAVLGELVRRVDRKQFRFALALVRSEFLAPEHDEPGILLAYHKVALARRRLKESRSLHLVANFSPRHKASIHSDNRLITRPSVGWFHLGRINFSDQTRLNRLGHFRKPRKSLQLRTPLMPCRTINVVGLSPKSRYRLPRVKLSSHRSARHRSNANQHLASGACHGHRHGQMSGHGTQYTDRHRCRSRQLQFDAGIFRQGLLPDLPNRA